MAGGLGGAAPVRGRFVLNHREFLSTLGLAAAALAGAEGLIVRSALPRVQAAAAAQSLFDRIKGLPPEVTPTDKFFVIETTAGDCRLQAAEECGSSFPA